MSKSTAKSERARRKKSLSMKHLFGLLLFQVFANNFANGECISYGLTIEISTPKGMRASERLNKREMKC